MKLYIDLLLICLIIIFIVDISGAIQGIFHPIVKKILKTNRSIRIPLIECSLCVTFWSGIIYLLAVHSFSIVNLSYVCLLSFMTPILKDIMMIFRDLLTNVLGKIDIY